MPITCQPPSSFLTCTPWVKGDGIGRVHDRMTSLVGNPSIGQIVRSWLGWPKITILWKYCNTALHTIPLLTLFFIAGSFLLTKALAFWLTCFVDCDVKAGCSRRVDLVSECFIPFLNVWFSINIFIFLEDISPDFTPQWLTCAVNTWPCFGIV